MSKIKVIGEAKVPPEAVEFAKGLEECANLQGNAIEAILLGGSHSKGLSNSRSDFDIEVYYSRSLNNLVSVTPRSITYHYPPGWKDASTSGCTKVLVGDNEFEIISIPLYSIGQGGKQLIPALYKQDGKRITDVLRHLPIKTTKLWDGLQRALHETFHYEIYRPMGYYAGYMKSQLLSHKRREDYSKRIAQAVKNKEYNPVVKAVIEGANIGLTGVSYQGAGIIYRDFAAMFKEYEIHFPPEERDFIWELYKHKTDQKRIVRGFVNFLDKCDRMRNSIFDKIREMQDYAPELAFPNELTPTQQKENAGLLNGILHETLGV